MRLTVGIKFKWLILCGEHVGSCFLNVSIRIVVRDLNNLNNPVKHYHCDKASYRRCHLVAIKPARSLVLLQLNNFVANQPEIGPM